MLHDNSIIDCQNGFSFLCLHYRFSKLAVVSMERLLALSRIKFNPVPVDT